MKVSIIIPTHNRLPQLKLAYNSVCQQTQKPDEIIIIDDGSTITITDSLINSNKTPIPTIIKRFSISQGACLARNYGVQIASGEIIMFLDDDDTWEAKKIATQLTILNNNPEIGLVYSGRLIVPESDRDRILYQIEPKAQGYLYPAILYSNLIGNTSSVAIKKSLFLEVGGFDVQLPALQDYDLWIRASQKTTIAHDHSCFVRYTIAHNYADQISGNPAKYIQAGKIVLHKYKTAIIAQGFLNSCKIRSAFYFFVARYARKQNFFLSLWWIIKSFLTYPNFKSLLLILPLDFFYFGKKTWQTWQQNNYHRLN